MNKSDRAEQMRILASKLKRAHNLRTNQVIEELIELVETETDNTPDWVKDGLYSHHLHVVKQKNDAYTLVFLKGSINTRMLQNSNTLKKIINKILSELKELCYEKPETKCCNSCSNNIEWIGGEKRFCTQLNCPLDETDLDTTIDYCSRRKPKPSTGKLYERHSADGKISDYFCKIGE